MTVENDNAASAPLCIELRPGMRNALADAVEAFLNLLDQIDADADLEDDDAPDDDAPCEDVGDDEPSLGSVGNRDASTPQFLWSHGAADDDREVEDEHDEPGGDDEPALGAAMAVNQQHAWRANSDAWGSCDEAEPSLGWTGHGRGHPEMALRGYADDREEEPDFEWTVGPWEIEFDGSEYL